MNAPFDEKHHYASQYLCACVCVYGFKLMSSREINGQSTIRNWVNGSEFKCDSANGNKKSQYKSFAHIHVSCMLFQPPTLLISNSSIFPFRSFISICSIFYAFPDHNIFSIVITIYMILNSMAQPLDNFSFSSIFPFCLCVCVFATSIWYA